jgi:hypothetical protein
MPWTGSVGSPSAIPTHLLLLLQRSLSRLLVLLARAAPDTVPAATVLRMAQHALSKSQRTSRTPDGRIVKVTLNPCALDVMRRSFEGLACAGVLQQEQVERTVSLGVKALHIHGAKTCHPFVVL